MKEVTNIEPTIVDGEVKSILVSYTVGPSVNFLPVIEAEVVASEPVETTSSEVTSPEVPVETAEVTEPEVAPEQDAQETV